MFWIHALRNIFWYITFVFFMSRIFIFNNAQFPTFKLLVATQLSIITLYKIHVIIGKNELALIFVCLRNILRQIHSKNRLCSKNNSIWYVRLATRCPFSAHSDMTASLLLFWVSILNTIVWGILLRSYIVLLEPLLWFLCFAMLPIFTNLPACQFGQLARFVILVAC